jgi:hypothetical protein
MFPVSNLPAGLALSLVLQSHVLQSQWFAQFDPPVGDVNDVISELQYRQPPRNKGERDGLDTDIRSTGSASASATAASAGNTATNHTAGVVGIRRLSMERYGRRTSGGGSVPQSDADAQQLHRSSSQSPVPQSEPKKGSGSGTGVKGDTSKGGPAPAATGFTADNVGARASKGSGERPYVHTWVFVVLTSEALAGDTCWCLDVFSSQR